MLVCGFFRETLSDPNFSARSGPEDELHFGGVPVVAASNLAVNGLVDAWGMKKDRDAGV